MTRCDGSVDLQSAEGTLGEGSVSPRGHRAAAAAAVPPVIKGVWVHCPPLLWGRSGWEAGLELALLEGPHRGEATKRLVQGGRCSGLAQEKGGRSEGQQHRFSVQSCFFVGGKGWGTSSWVFCEELMVLERY